MKYSHLAPLRLRTLAGEEPPARAESPSRQQAQGLLWEPCREKHSILVTGNSILGTCFHQRWVSAPVVVCILLLALNTYIWSLGSPRAWCQHLTCFYYVATWQEASHGRIDQECRLGFLLISLTKQLIPILEVPSPHNPICS